MDAKEFQQIKDKAEESRRRADKAQGAMDQLLRKLKDDYDCDSVEQAKTLLFNLEQDEHKAAEGYEEELQAFKEEFGGRLA